MAHTQKLTDTQLILLSTAAQRESGNLLPPPESLGDYTLRLAKAVATLIKKGLAIETQDATGKLAWRRDGDLHFGAAISAAGLAAIGVESDQTPDLEGRQLARKSKAGQTGEHQSPPAPTSPPSKQAQVIHMMQRDDGATLGELVASTGWLPHTARAALTGLRKKGHLISRDKRGEVTCYRIKAGS
jgi:hypothetical protein